MWFPSNHFMVVSAIAAVAFLNSASSEPQKGNVSATNADVVVAAASTTSARKLNHDGSFDQVFSPSGMKISEESFHETSDTDPKKEYSYSYDSGPQYYESTSKPVSYSYEYKSPPKSYSHSYDSGPQGYSHQSKPKKSSHSSHYSNQDGGEFSEGDDDHGGEEHDDFEEGEAHASSEGGGEEDVEADDGMGHYYHYD